MEDWIESGGFEVGEGLEGHVASRHKGHELVLDLVHHYYMAHAFMQRMMIPSP